MEAPTEFTEQCPLCSRSFDVLSGALQRHAATCGDELPAIPPHPSDPDISSQEQMRLARLRRFDSKTTVPAPEDILLCDVPNCSDVSADHLTRYLHAPHQSPLDAKPTKRPYEDTSSSSHNSHGKLRKLDPPSLSGLPVSSSSSASFPSAAYAAPSSSLVSSSSSESSSLTMSSSNRTGPNSMMSSRYDSSTIASFPHSILSSSSSSSLLKNTTPSSSHSLSSSRKPDISSYHSSAPSSSSSPPSASLSSLPSSSSSSPLPRSIKLLTWNCWFEEVEVGECHPYVCFHMLSCPPVTTLQCEFVCFFGFPCSHSEPNARHWRRDLARGW